MNLIYLFVRSDFSRSFKVKVQKIRSSSFNMNTMQKDSSRFIIEHVFWKNASVNK